MADLRGSDPSHRLVAHAAFAVLLAGWVAYAVTGDSAIRNVVQVSAVVLMGVHAALQGRPRRLVRCSTVANATWGSGTSIPFALNAFYLVSYVFAHLAGLVVLVAAQARIRWRTALALDGIVAASPWRPR